MSITEEILSAKERKRILSSSSSESRNKAILAIRDELVANKEYIFSENQKDLENAALLPDSIRHRLLFDQKKLEQSILSLEDVASLSDPLDKVLEKRSLCENLILQRVSVPLGIIAMIFEARPDALIQIVSLALKSGNVIVLKGGKEAKNSNRALFEVIRKALMKTDIPEDSVILMESHSDVSEILSLSGIIDLVIPRGSNSFVRYIMDNTSIPVLGHADGVCSLYVDKDADLEMAVKIAVDSKCQYPSACNSIETLLVHEDVSESFLPLLKAAFEKENVIVHSDKKAFSLIGGIKIEDDEEYRREFLDKEINIKVVSSLSDVFAYLERYSSHHTDSIVTDNKETARVYAESVDSADVFINCSTRFADGYRFGLGAEVGISTSKIHARGPVGLMGLTSSKWILSGCGDVVSDFAEGRKKFAHKDLL